MSNLPVNYADAVLDGDVNDKRRYRLINNEDGTVSFEDVTEYTVVGSNFGAGDINQTNAKVNEINNNLVEDVPVESDASSSENAYTTGEHFMLNGQYCVATDDITIGDALVENTNYEEDSMGNAIEQINTSLTELIEKVGSGMKVIESGTTNATKTIDLSSYNFTSKDDYSVRITGSNSYNWQGATGVNTCVAYGYGIGAYISNRTATSVTITVSSGITCSYEIIRLA